MQKEIVYTFKWEDATTKEVFTYHRLNISDWNLIESMQTFYAWAQGRIINRLSRTEN